MKGVLKGTAISLTSMALLIAASPLLANIPMPPMLKGIPFWAWPTLYQTAENLVIKRGIDVDGTINDKVYLRIGWGPCLAVSLHEFDELVAAAQTDRYINLRDYADANLNADGEKWGENDSWNCAKDPEDGTDITDIRWAT